MRKMMEMMVQHKVNEVPMIDFPFCSKIGTKLAHGKVDQILAQMSNYLEL